MTSTPHVGKKRSPSPPCPNEGCRRTRLRPERTPTVPECCCHRRCDDRGLVSLDTGQRIAVGPPADPAETATPALQPPPDDRVVAVHAVASLSRKSEHSQRCPVWLGRAKNVGLDRCNCWIIRDAERIVSTVLTALDGPTRTPMALCRGCNARGAACWAEGGHCCDLCDHTPEETSDGR